MIQAACTIEVELLPGKKGEFTVRFNDEVIAEKGLSFPIFSDIVETVLQRIQ